MLHPTELLGDDHPTAAVPVARVRGCLDRLDRLGAGNALTGNIQNPQFDDTDAVMTALASKKLLAFKEVAHGFYFWNFRNELEPSWSWLAARDAGWLAALDDSRALLRACARFADGRIAKTSVQCNGSFITIS